MSLLDKFWATLAPSAGSQRDHSWEVRYYAGLALCGVRYRLMLGEPPDLGESGAELYSFIREFEREARAGVLSLGLLNRWLGYIQGRLIARGTTTVYAEWVWTNPIFGPLDTPNP